MTGSHKKKSGHSQVQAQKEDHVKTGRRWPATSQKKKKDSEETNPATP